MQPWRRLRRSGPGQKRQSETPHVVSCPPDRRSRGDETQIGRSRKQKVREEARSWVENNSLLDRHRLPAARCKPLRRMTLTWQDTEDIAWVLRVQYPELHPLRLSFPRLRELVLALPDFQDAADGCNEAVLEAIQMAWFEETR